MSNYYNTMVSTVPEYFQEVLYTNLSKDKRYTLEKTPSGALNIISNYAPAVNEILKVSDQFPEALFRIKTATEDVYDNYVRLYECKNGHIRIITEGLEYVFSFNKNDLMKLPDGAYDAFCKGVSEYLNRIGNNDIAFDLNFNDCKIQKPQISMLFYQKGKDYRIEVEKQGRTYLPIKISFFKEPVKEEPKMNSLPDYDDLPF